VGELLCRQQRVEDWFERLRAQLHAALGFTQRLTIRRGQERHRLGLVADLVLDQDRLVVGDEADDVVAGDVLRGQHDHFRPVELGVEVDTEEAGVRLGRADRVAVPGAREDHIVGIEGSARQLGRALAPKRGHARCANSDLTGFGCSDRCRRRFRPRRGPRRLGLDRHWRRW
jgi:hypothetical protein